MEEDEKKKAISEEESIVYSLAILFANRMIYLTVPLDAHEQMINYNERRRKKDRAMQRLQIAGTFCCKEYFGKFVVDNCEWA